MNDNNYHDSSKQAMPSQSDSNNAQLSALYLCREEDRYRTLMEWENHSQTVSKTQVAKNGFYYTGTNNVIKCNFCGLEINSLADCDNIENLHRTLNPNCNFVLKKPVGNIPVELHIRINEGVTPKYPEFTLESKRLQTYERCWPVQFKQTPQILAQAGLFFTGISDQTICFQCGGGLKNWELDDDPWQQHAKWFPKCQYVRLCLDEDDIKKVDELTELKYNERKVFSNDVSDLCNKCRKERKNVCMLPCGHIIHCANCNDVTLKNCPVCNKDIQYFIKVFYA